MNWKLRLRGIALLALALFVLAPLGATPWLKQSTSVTVQMGPFLDETDGKTAETGLTMDMYDINVSKNGAAFADKHEESNATHDTAGWYRVPLDTTDTGTLGLLTVAVHESGALPVWQTYMVVRADIYDGICSTDYIQVDVIQVASATPTTAADIADAVWNETSTGHTTAGYAGEQLWTDVDAILVDTAVIGALGAGLTAIPWNATWDAEVESEVDDALGAGTGTSLSAIPWNSSWDAEVESEVDDSIGGGTGTALTAVPWNAAWDAQVQSEVEDGIAAHVVEDAITMDQAMRLVIAFIAGKADGGGTTTIHYRDQGDSLNRITLTVDANGNRTASALVVTD